MPRKRRRAKRVKEYRKPGVSRARFRKDAAFKNSRLAAGDFGRASQCAVLVRQELVCMLELSRHHIIHRKLSQVIGALLKEKRASGAERVRLNTLQWQQFEKMNFNSEAGIETLLFGTPEILVNTLSGKIELLHPSFDITPKIKESKSITHVRIIAGATAINFDRKKAAHDYAATEYIPKEQSPDGKIILSMQLPAPVTDPLFVVLGILCAKQEGDKALYPMANRRFKALSVVLVQPAPPPAYKTKPAPPVKPARPSKKPTAKKSAAKKPAAKTKNRKPSKKPASKKRSGK